MVHYLSVLDLFCGPGGLSEGFKNARNHNFRFKVEVSNDYDRDVALTYKKNHPETEFVLGSISDESVKKEILKSIESRTGRRSVDVVIGGPPCKGFSLENKMSRHMQNPMNHLVMHYVDMIKRTKPAAFVMENVPGLLAMEKGGVVKLLLSAFRELGYKNATAWLLNAADYGVPQLRKRAFLVGSRSEIPIAEPVPTHGSSGGDGRILSNYVKLIDTIDDLPKIRTGKIQSDSDNYTKAPNKFQKEMRKNSDKVLNHIVTKNSDLVIKRMKSVPPGGNWKDIPRDLMQVDGKYSAIEKAHSMIYKRLLPNEPSVTLTNFRKGMMIHPSQHRLFSVREAARIQTFPDHFEFMGGISSQQQQVSDAVPTLLATKVAESVLLHLHNVIKLPVTSRSK